MRTTWHLGRPRHTCAVRLVLVGLIALGTASCTSPQDPMRRMTPTWIRAGRREIRSSLKSRITPSRGPFPRLPMQRTSTMTRSSAQCHPAYAKSFAQSVHRGGGCESCHGPASKHVEARGKTPGLIFSFKSGDPVRAGGSLPAVP